MGKKSYGVIKLDKIEKKFVIKVFFLNKLQYQWCTYV